MANNSNGAKTLGISEQHIQKLDLAHGTLQRDSIMFMFDMLPKAQCHVAKRFKLVHIRHVDLDVANNSMACYIG